MKIVMSQIKSKPGFPIENGSHILKEIDYAFSLDADIIVFPELCIPGYPALDLYFDLEYNRICFKVLDEIIEKSKHCKDLLIVVGCHSLPTLGTDKRHNELYYIWNGCYNTYVKHALPDYDIFFENRYFRPQEMDLGYNTVVFNNKKIGFLICEDIWYDGYYSSPYQNLMKKKPDIVISINASPYVQGKLKTRINKVKEIMRKCKDLHVPEYFVYVNSVGSHDGYDGEVVFDGGSFIVDKNRDVVSFCEEFVETTVLFDTEDYNKKSFKIDSSKDIEKTIRAIEIGIKSYFDRFNMKKAIIGLSGGIDSAVTAALSAASLGSENVIGVSMPSHYSSDGSITDAKDLAKNLGIDYINIPIKEVVYSYGDILSKTINPFYETITEENIQARIRGNILMALSNSIPGSMVLSTGNKTELALGYCTPYGDMAGGLSPLADVDKTNVYLIAEKINRKREIIPVNTITKPPSAELAPNQTDEKGLGFSYDILVDAVNYVIEKGIFQKEKLEEYLLKFEGIDAKKMSDMVMDRIVKNEWKRRQAAPGIKVTLKAFGSGRRVPLLY